MEVNESTAPWALHVLCVSAAPRIENDYGVRHELHKIAPAKSTEFMDKATVMRW